MIIMDNEFVNIAAHILKTQPALLNKNSTTGSVPEWDSLSHWLLIAGLEAHYGIEFSMPEATGFKCLGDIYNTIRSKQS